MKLSFLHYSSRATLCLEELAAALDWILTFQSQQKQVVVIDVNTGTVKTSDFAMINKIYGSKLELLPRLSAGMLANTSQVQYRVQSL